MLCCADEAALCWACDEKVHAANKLASKHQRVPLSTSTSQMPKCDICQVCLITSLCFSFLLNDFDFDFDFDLIELGTTHAIVSYGPQHV